MAVLSRLALSDVVDTTKCAREFPERDLADAMANVYISDLSSGAVPEPATSPIAQPGWAPDELARLHAWANADSPASEPMDVAVDFDENPENFVPPPFLVLFGTDSAPTHRAPTAKKANFLSGKRPRPYMPPTVYLIPPPAPSKRTVQLKKGSGSTPTAPTTQQPAQARPKPPSCLKKVRVPLAEAEARHAASIAQDPMNVVCTFPRCGYISLDPHSHRKHMLSHATYAFVCSYCSKALSSQTNLNNHVKNLCNAAAATT